MDEWSGIGRRVLAGRSERVRRGLRRWEGSRARTGRPPRPYEEPCLGWPGVAGIAVPRIPLPALSLKGEGAVRARRKARQVRRAHKAERFIRHGEGGASPCRSELARERVHRRRRRWACSRARTGRPPRPYEEPCFRDGPAWRGLGCHISLSPALSLKGEGAIQARRVARQVRKVRKGLHPVGASLLANEFTGGADAGLVREQELGVPLVPANSRSSRDGRSWRGLRCHVSLSPARSLKGEGAIRARRVALQHDRHECPLSLRNGARSQG